MKNLTSKLKKFTGIALIGMGTILPSYGIAEETLDTSEKNKDNYKSSNKSLTFWEKNYQEDLKKVRGALGEKWDSLSKEERSQIRRNFWEDELDPKLIIAIYGEKDIVEQYSELPPKKQKKIKNFSFDNIESKKLREFYKENSPWINPENFTLKDSIYLLILDDLHPKGRGYLDNLQ